MSAPVQQLGVVARLFPQVCSGEKLSTIRWREARIVPGEMIYVCDDDATLQVRVIVTKCSDMALRGVAEYLGQSSVWPPDIMLRGMREHYPTITLDDVVQVIEHLPPEAG